MVFLKCLKEPSALSSLTEGEDEQHILLHDGWRHTQCACIPSSVHATAPRKMSKSRANLSILRTDVPSSQHNGVVQSLQYLGNPSFEQLGVASSTVPCVRYELFHMDKDKLICAILENSTVTPK
jgi:hypothetical protein